MADLELTGQQIEQFKEALASAFPNQSALSRMLRFKLNKKLNNLVGGGALNQMVFDLIDVAESEGWLAGLLKAAREQNQGNLKLKKFEQGLSSPAKAEPTANPSPVNNNVSDREMRTVSPQPQAQPQAVPDRILFISASPLDEVRLQSDREHRLLKAELERGSERDKYEFLSPQFSVTIPELIRAIKGKPHIIHFSGHASTEGIMIDHGDGTSEMLPLGAIQRLFRPVQDTLRLVILNGCYSFSQATEISKMGCYVIGHNLEVSDKNAIRFTQGFYASLGEGSNVQDAYNDALVMAFAISDVVSIWKDGKELNW